MDAKGEELDRISGFRPPDQFISAIKPILAGKSYGALKKKAEKEPDNLEVAVELGKKEEERRQYAKAEALYKKVLDAKDAGSAIREAAEGRMALLSFMKSRGRDIAGLHAYFDKKKDTAGVVDHARLLMRAYQDGDEVAKVVAVSEYLIRHVGETDATLLNNYAWFLATHDEKLGRALELARKAAKLQPEAAFILDTLGECLFRSGKLKEAVDANDDCKWVWLGKAKTFEDCRELATALQTLEHDGPTRRAICQTATWCRPDAAKPGDWDEADRPKALARVATTLAGFHSVRRRWPGSILRPTRTSAVERYMPRLIRRLQRLIPVIGSGTTERLTQCLRDRGSVLCSRQSYELIHGRVNDNNFLVDEERAWAIDLATVQYGDAGRDLIHAIHRLCLGDEKQTEEFLSGYFSEVRGLDRKNFDLQRPFYSGEIHISTAARLMRHWAENLEKEQTREKVTRCVEDAFHHLES